MWWVLMWKKQQFGRMGRPELNFLLGGIDGILGQY